MISGYGIIDLASLPTQPAALLAAIKRQVDARERPAASSVSVFEWIADRLLFASTSSSLRAALYRVIAHLPGVTLLGWQTDRLGRRGIAVTISRAEVGDETTRRELVFDPTTGEPLQTELIQTAALPSGAGTGSTAAAVLPAGTVLTYTVFIGQGVVNSIDELPGGRLLPYHRFLAGQ